MTMIIVLCTFDYGRSQNIPCQLSKSRCRIVSNLTYKLVTTAKNNLMEEQSRAMRLQIKQETEKATMYRSTPSSSKKASQIAREDSVFKLARKWQEELQCSKVKSLTVRNVTQRFSSALATVSEVKAGNAVHKVEGSAAFNGGIHLCVLYLQPGIYRDLIQHENSNIPVHKCRKWKNLGNPLKNFLVNWSRLVEHVSCSKILRVLLKLVHQVAAMLSSYRQTTKPIFKRLFVLWSAPEEETNCVVAFLCILKMTRKQQTSVLKHVLKAMYLAYVRNSELVSPNALANINFKRRSLVGLVNLDWDTTYQLAFLYIRKLIIHLRTTVMFKRKDSFKAVYNWQFINSTRLWTDLVGATAQQPQLQPLICPLVSIATGVIKLIPTAQNVTLRCHVVPFILEVLNSSTFNKDPTIVSRKPMSFVCTPRLNKAQVAENGFRNEVVENVCGLTFEMLAYEARSLAYPDLVVPCVLTLKQRLNKCKVANYTRKLKLVLDKIVENSKFVEKERMEVKFGLHECNLIQSWETNLRKRGTPLNRYYPSWMKTHESKRKRQAANTNGINAYNIPTMKRKKADQVGKLQKRTEGPTELCPSDSEDELEVNILRNSDDADSRRIKGNQVHHEGLEAEALRQSGLG